MTRMNLAIWYLNFMLFDGAVPAKEIIATGTRLGFSRTTLERAKKTMGFISIPERDDISKKVIKWWWR